MPSKLAIEKQSAADDPTQYSENRLKALEAQKAQGLNPYPHKFDVSMSLSEYIQKYKSSLIDGEHRMSDEVSLAGRVMSKRGSGGKLCFYDLHSSGAKVQVVASLGHSNLEEDKFRKFHNDVKLGDIVAIAGFPGKGGKGELSIFSQSFTVLSYCVHMIPSQKSTVAWNHGNTRNPDAYTLKDKETRFHQRGLDLMVNSEVRRIFITRKKIVDYVRKFLNSNGLSEVETPALNRIPGGAAARSFVTHHNDLNMQLYMRISPEHRLKELLVDGFERVYEIGKQFWDEAVDPTHNPEFTTCEFYQANSDYNVAMNLTEKMFCKC